MAFYLLDTNHLGEAIGRVSLVRDRIQQKRRHGHRFVVCPHVLCELEAGIQDSEHEAEMRRQLRLVRAIARLWPIDEQATRDYGSIFLELTRRGRQLSQTDIVLAALARRHRMILLTTDRDFEALPDLQLEDWTLP